MAQLSAADLELHKYRTGGCFALALALGELLSLEPRIIDFGSCVHAFVLTENQEVIDIHGKHSWDAFLQMLIAEKVLPPHACAPGMVTADPMPARGREPILWRHLGYRHPSKAAVAEASRVAMSHPNLALLVNSQQ